MMRTGPISDLPGAGFQSTGIARAAAGAILLASSCLLPASAGAQEASEPAQPSSPAPSLHLELNALQSSERGCRFTFVAANRLEGEVTRAAFEIALFNKEGMISRMTVVDFRDLPQGKTKVRQFDFPGVDCSDVGRVLVNDATECTGEGIAPDACIRGLQAETLSDVVFGT